MSRRRNLLQWAARTRSAHEKADLPTPKAKPKTPEERMNKGEREYAQLLDQRRADGHVAAWWYEPMSWRLADQTYFRGDFLVMLPDGSLEMHEVKPRKTKKGPNDTRIETFHAEDDAWQKTKIAAEQMPWPVVVVYPTKANGWQERRL